MDTRLLTPFVWRLQRPAPARQRVRVDIVLREVVDDAIARDVALEDLEVRADGLLSVGREERDPVLAVEHYELPERHRAGLPRELELRGDQTGARYRA
jgi:hypothetical protein